MRIDIAVYIGITGLALLLYWLADTIALWLYAVIYGGGL